MCVICNLGFFNFGANAKIEKYVGVADWLCGWLQTSSEEFDSPPRLINFLRSEKFIPNYKLPTQITKAIAKNYPQLPSFAPAGATAGKANYPHKLQIF